MVQNPYETNQIINRKPRNRTGFLCLVFAVFLLISELILDLMITSGGRVPHPLGKGVSALSSILAGSVSMIVSITGCYFGMRYFIKNQLLVKRIVGMASCLLNLLWTLLLLFLVVLSSVN